MRKVMEFVKKNKVIVGISAGIIVLVIVGVILFVSLKATDEASLEDSLKEMGKDFYENYYYEAVAKGKNTDEIENTLSKFSSLGIKINLDNLSRHNKEVNEEKIKAFVNEKTNKECDKSNTKVIIYPKSPYGKTDYSMEVELDCGFDEE